MIPGARSRATTWASLTGYALLASGLPLPVGLVSPTARDAAAEKRLVGKDRSVPFPCMDKPCGCATAEQCFADCCCHTPAERLAWARAHRVEAHVLAALERRIADVEAPAPSAGGCCAVEADGDATACCAPDPAPPTPPRTTPGRTVTLTAMLACDGIAAEWFALGTAPPPPRLVLSLLAPPVGRVRCAHAAPRDLSVAPATPPPRCA